MTTTRNWRTLHDGVSSSARILIVDDDPEIRDTLQRLVTSAGWTAQTAAGAEAADMFLSSGSFDVCLLDMELPGMSGPEFLPWALTRDPMLAVIMVTGLNDTKLALETMGCGARTYLVKPVSAPFLIHAIKDALALRNVMIERNQGWQV